MGGFGSFLFWFFAIFGGVVCLALLGVLVFVWLQIRVYLGLVDKVMAVTESGLRFVGVETKLTKFRLFKMALKFLLSKKARANALGSAKDFAVNRVFRRKKKGNGASLTAGLKQVAKRNEEVLLKMAYNEAVNFAKAEAGKVLSGEQIGPGDAKETALKSGGRLLRAARDEAVKEAMNLAKDEARLVLSGDAEENSVEENPAEAPAKETENFEGSKNAETEQASKKRVKKAVNLPERETVRAPKNAAQGNPVEENSAEVQTEEAENAEGLKNSEVEKAGEEVAQEPVKAPAVKAQKTLLSRLRGSSKHEPQREPETVEATSNARNAELKNETQNAAQETKAKKPLFGKLRGALTGNLQKKEMGSLEPAEAASAPKTEAKSEPEKQPNTVQENGEEPSSERGNIPAETPAGEAGNVEGGKNSAALKKVCRGMERLLSQEPIDEAKLASVVKKLLSPNSGLEIPASEWAKWGKLARQKGAYEIAATLLEKAAGEI